MDERTDRNLQLRSELAREIISKRPGFAERWALTIFLCILLSVFAASWFLKYPDIIEANATLTATNAPKEIIVRQEGRLVRLFTRNSEKVRKGDVLAWIESTADHRELMDLSRRVDSGMALLNAGQSERLSGLFSRQFANLGEIQQGYRDFITALQLFNDYLVNGFYAKRRRMLESDARALGDARLNLQDQLALSRQDLSLSAESFAMNEQLYDEKVISKKDFSTEKSTYINKQMSLPQLQASLLANETQARDKIKEIDQVDHDLAQEKIIFRQALQTLKSTIDDWKKRYVVQAPVDGSVFFIMPVQENQYLQQGKLIGFVNPEESRFYAESYLPQANFGKIDTGLKVQLRFAAYPYQEVGFVEGTLNYVSGVAADSGFLATIRLDRGLVTNNKIPILYRSGLKAQAIVITKNMRLLERLYYNVVKSTSVGTK